MLARAAIAAVAVAGVAGSGSALARMCHPDPPGTRTLVVHGQVTGYTMHAIHVGLAYIDADGCTHRVAWNVAETAANRTIKATSGRCRAPVHLGDAVRVSSSPHVVSAFEGRRHASVGVHAVTLFSGSRRVGMIRRSTGQPAAKAILRGSRLVVLVRGSEDTDKPDRLEVYDTAAMRARGSWPLVEPAVTLDVAGNVAVFSAEGRRGIYALRLSDGATRFVGPTWTGDTPQIEQAGVVYEDLTFDRDRLSHRVPLKFVPTAALASEFAHTARTLHTDGAVTGLSFDGPNLAVTFRGSTGECDQVKIWQGYWEDIATPTMDRGVGCVPGDLIEGVAETGIIARWIVRAGGGQRLVWSSSKNCVQHLVAVTSGDDRLLVVAGHPGVLPDAIRHQDGTSTLVTSRGYANPQDVRTDLAATPTALVTDGNRLAVLDPDGNVSILSATGDFVASVAVGEAPAIALD